MGDAVQSSLLLKFDFDAVSHFLGSGRAVKEVKKYRALQDVTVGRPLEGSWLISTPPDTEKFPGF